jgi:hypothetical protein
MKPKPKKGETHGEYMRRIKGCDCCCESNAKEYSMDRRPGYGIWETVTLCSKCYKRRCKKDNETLDRVDFNRTINGTWVTYGNSDPDMSTT